MKATTFIFSFLILTVIAPTSIHAQYCASSATSTADSRCDGVQLTGNTITLNNPTTNCGMYTDHTSGVNVPDMTAGSAYTINLTNGTCGGAYTRYANAWIDFNNDNDFLDAGEMLGAGTVGNGTNGFVHVINFTVPVGATAGNTRMRVIVKESGSATNSCAGYTWGETEDYTVNIAAAGPMAYSSCTASQPTTSGVMLGNTDQEVIRLEIVTTGSTSPLSATQIRCRTTGTTSIADIANAKLWYTGNSSTFATTTQYGGTVASPPGGATNMTFNGAQTLASGTNYFWLTYDVQAGATLGNVIDGRFHRTTISGTNYFPTTPTPAGSRTIVAVPTSPGGVNTNILFWLKADAGLTTAGANVTGWTDQSTASTAITVNGSPDEVAVGRNYNPIINWTKSNGVDGGDFLSTADVTVQSYFCAAQLTELNRSSTHMVTYDGVTLAAPCAQCATHGGSNGGGVAQYAEVNYGNANFQSAGVWRTNGDPTGVAYNTAHSGNFDIVTSRGTGTGSANVFLGGQNDNLPGFNGRPRDWFGPVGEMIVYSGAITTTEANKIESYLGIKYGITLGGNGSTTLAYNSSVGTNYWSANSGYHNDIIGLGRDDNQELLQKQSQAPDDSSRIYLSTLQASNVANAGTFASDQSYVMMGSNKGRVCNTPGALAEIPGTCGLYSRLEREWKITKTNFSEDISIDIKLNGCGAPGSVSVSQLRLLVDNDGDFSNGGTTCYFNGDGSGVTFTYSNPTITISGISAAVLANNSSSFITVGSILSTTPLPIELTTFEANCTDSQVQLFWQTASETNNKFFSIERSQNGVNFENVERIDGGGNSSTPLFYNWTDLNPLAGTSYYRLTQTDYDGETNVLSTKSVGCQELHVVNVYPNPFNESLTLDLGGLTEYPVSVSIVDALGRVVYQEIITETKNRNELQIAQSLLPGTYFLNINTRNQIITKKIIKATN